MTAAHDLPLSQSASTNSVSGITDTEDWFLGPQSPMWKMFANPFVTIFGLERDGMLNILDPHFTVAFVEHDIGMTRPDIRIQRIARFFTHAIYGTKTEAVNFSRAVTNAHERVRGFDPVTGTDYYAAAERSLLICHAILWMSVAKMYEEYIAPLTAQERDDFTRDAAKLGALIGVPETLLTWAQMEEYWESLRPSLSISPSGRMLVRPFTVGKLWPGNPAETLLPRPLYVALRPVLGMALRMYADLAWATIDRVDSRMLGLERGPVLRSPALVRWMGKGVARLMGTPALRDRIERFLGPGIHKTAVRARAVMEGGREVCARPQYQ